MCPALANAGHLNPYRKGKEIELEAWLPIGIAPGIPYIETQLHLEPGDMLTFLSDGVVEARSPSGELFGFERTQEISNRPASVIAETAQQYGQNDDITVLSLTRIAEPLDAPSSVISLDSASIPA